jgi:DNA modification methylase
MFAKDRSYYFNRAAISNVALEEDVWTINARPNATPGINTAPFPQELVQRCLDIACPEKGVVLDPFAGSGTTLLTALQSGRSAIAIDLNPQFCRYMVRKVGDLL